MLQSTVPSAAFFSLRFALALADLESFRSSGGWYLQDTLTKAMRLIVTNARR
jgi:hypothetical protein